MVACCDGENMGAANLYGFVQLLEPGMHRFSESYNIFLQRLKLLFVVNSMQLFLSAALVLSSSRVKPLAPSDAAGR